MHWFRVPLPFKVRWNCSEYDFVANAVDPCLRVKHFNNIFNVNLKLTIKKKLKLKKMYLVLQISCIWIQLCGERALNIVTKGHYLRPNLNSIDVNALIGIGLIHHYRIVTLFLSWSSVCSPLNLFLGGGGIRKYTSNIHYKKCLKPFVVFYL